jgi:hypothetical protein
MESFLEETFTSKELMSTARKAGFCKRESKLNPLVFFDLLMYDSISTNAKSLNQLAIEALASHDIGISKQVGNKCKSDRRPDRYDSDKLKIERI